tara:strand:+ start:772 stop:2187 length:1416 start_codon:yes stop_codon:yes gene_type:complete
MEFELCFKTADELSHLISSKQVSPVQVVEEHLRRIELLEPKLNSYISIMRDSALKQAKEHESEILGGTYRGPLHGVPVALKDIFYVTGVPNTYGSKINQDFVPHFNSTVVNKFADAGAILIGKLNLHQFAFGPTGENHHYGDMHNPWDIDSYAGGSSGGSGSAVAAGQATIAMGSDTGGSIRIPSALCGIVGLKPTFGRVSKYGVSPLGWSLDHVGPMVRTVKDSALVLNAIAGYDQMDSCSVNRPVPDFTAGLSDGIEGIRVGVPKEYFDFPVHPQVKSSVDVALVQLEKLGAKIIDVDWPIFSYAFAISTVLLITEASAGLSKLVMEKGPEFQPGTRLRVEGGMFYTANDYLKAQRARRLFVDQTRELMDKVDVLVGPMVPSGAPKIGQTEVDLGSKHQGIIPTLTQYTRAFNINGFPAMTLPCGFTDSNMPIGLQIAGRPWEEETVLKVGHAFEKATDWHTKRPPAFS